MITQIRSVYTSTAPDVLAALDAVEAAYAARAPLVAAWHEEFPGTQLWGYDGRIDSVYFPARHAETGETLTSYGWLTPIDPNWPDPKVWCKLSNKARDARKYRPRARGGEEMAARLAAMSYNRRPSLPGMPSHAGMFSRPGMRVVGEGNGRVVWAYWLVDSESVETHGFDPTIWTRMKVSDYYVMLESLPAGEQQDDE